MTSGSPSLLSLLLPCFFFAIVSSHDSDRMHDHLAKTPLLRELTDVLDELDSMEEKHDLIRRQLELADRHGLKSTNMFSVYQTSNWCGTGIVTNWITHLQVVNNVPGQTSLFNVGSGVMTVPAVPNVDTQYWFFQCSHNCAQGSACDRRFYINGSPVAAYGNRDNQLGQTAASGSSFNNLVGGNRFEQMSQVHIAKMNTGDTFWVQEEAGGGNPKNCAQTGAWRASQCSGWCIRGFNGTTGM